LAFLAPIMRHWARCLRAGRAHRRWRPAHTRPSSSLEDRPPAIQVRRGRLALVVAAHGEPFERQGRVEYEVEALAEDLVEVRLGPADRPARAVSQPAGERAGPGHDLVLGQAVVDPAQS